MLNGVDLLLRRLMLDEATLLRPAGGAPVDDQVGFQPPDKTWRTGLGERRAINIYLADLREKAALRSNEVVRDTAGQPTGERPPAWVDCHYLVTAWSPATTEAGGRLDEHALLYQAMQVLLAHPTLSASDVFHSRPFPAGFPPELVDAELPAAVVPPDGFPKLAEFWGTMGQAEAWRPAAYLIVTVPVLFPTQPIATPVTTRMIHYRAAGSGGAEVRAAIGGRVLDTTGSAPAQALPLPGAWVRLEDDTGVALLTTRTDASGRFTFADLPPGSYRLRYRAGNRPEPEPRDVDVPSTTGEYDLRFS